MGDSGSSVTWPEEIDDPCRLEHALNRDRGVNGLITSDARSPGITLRRRG
jgi:hypothetical protein